MNTYFPNPRQTVESAHGSVFNHLRERLSQEVSCKEFADLIESVNAMQRAAQTALKEFNLRFGRVRLQGGRVHGYGQAVLSSAGRFPALPTD